MSTFLDYLHLENWYHMIDDGKKPLNQTETHLYQFV